MMAKPWKDVASSEAYQSLSSEQQDEARLQYFQKVVAPKVPKDKVMDVFHQFESQTRASVKPIDPTEGMSTYEKITAGAGKTLHDIYQGASERLGMVKPSDVEESRRIDQPLMATASGKAGAVLGAAVPVAATALIPGVNSVVGGAATGAAMGALQPTTEGESVGKNVVKGGVLGTIGQITGQSIGAAAGKLYQSSKTALEAKRAINMGRDTAVKEARSAGYVLPPTQAKPSLLNKFLEGPVSGKIQTAQKASEMNQTNTNRLVKQAMGLDKDLPITSDALLKVRQQAGKVYASVKAIQEPFRADTKYLKDISELGGDFKAAQREFPEITKSQPLDDLISGLSKQEMSPQAAIEIVRKLRADATLNIKSFTDPQKQALGFAQRKAADAVDSLIERNLKQSGNNELYSSYRQARQIIAKSHDVEAALNDSTGNVSARYLGRLLDKKRPLTGELRTIAKFAKAFPKASQNVEGIGSQPGWSPLEMGVGLMSPKPEVWGALAGRPVARAGILSAPYQRFMLNNNYDVGAGTSLANILANNPYIRQAGVVLPNLPPTDPNQ